MGSPETRRTTKHESDTPNPDREESPLTSRESQETRKLNPEQAVQDEESRLNGVLTNIAERIKTMPQKAKMAMAVFLGASALTFAQGSFQEVHAGRVRQGVMREQSVSIEHAQPSPKSTVFEQYAEQSWRKFAQELKLTIADIKEQSRHGSKGVMGLEDIALEELDDEFLQMIRDMRGDPLLDSGTNQQMMERKMQEWVGQYLSEWESAKGVPSREYSQEMRPWLNRLGQKVPWLFDKNRDGVLDGEETTALDKEVRENLGISALMKVLQQEQERGEQKVQQQEQSPVVTRHSEVGPGEPGFCSSMRIGQKVILMAAGGGKNTYESRRAAQIIASHCAKKFFGVDIPPGVAEDLVVQDMADGIHKVATARMVFDIP